MSSGQISAVVISLTLALNKVYASRFGTVLIDDPVQTMDYVNMSSLIEVLRNDFSEKQIILLHMKTRWILYLQIFKAQRERKNCQLDAAKKIGSEQ